jgi:hypothetical protein
MTAEKGMALSKSKPMPTIPNPARGEVVVRWPERRAACA